MAGTVAQFIQILDRIAPPRLAEAWDQIGLQVGSRDWVVNKVWTALDPLPEVVAMACENDVELLITHHPLFFKSINCIDCDTPSGRIAEMALSNRMAIFSAHTNLDSVSGGVNDVLARRMALTKVQVLADSANVDAYKLVVFAPLDDEQIILDSLFKMDAGRLGAYSCCSFRSSGTGTFLPGDGASPFVGENGVLSEVKESRIEILVNQNDLNRVVNALKMIHPYEHMVYDVYPLRHQDDRTGLGRVGQLVTTLTVRDLSLMLKTELNLSTIKISGDPDRVVKTVAVCSGSGAGLMKAALAVGAQAYVSGDLGYHTARDAQQAGLSLIDVGHFSSEHPVIHVLAASIRDAIKESGITATVEAADMETDPFQYL
jgi:dinuclear metal center YbgI/SA1388 family protein